MGARSERESNERDVDIFFNYFSTIKTANSNKGKEGIELKGSESESGKGKREQIRSINP